MSAPTNHRLRANFELEVLVLTLVDAKLQDEQTAEELLQETVANVEHYQARKVVVDFRQVRYVSSVAFRPLLCLRRHLQEVNGRMVLCNLSSVAGDVFRTTKLVSADGSFTAPFEIASDLSAATALLSAPAGHP
jgi:anti-anti-sigma factor